MIRIEQHPLVRQDLRELARHVADISGDPRAAMRRLDQVPRDKQGENPASIRMRTRGWGLAGRA